MSSLESIRRSRVIGRACWLSLALFSLRAIVPLGYMPASLSDGGPFTLCPGTSPITPEMPGDHEKMHHAVAMDRDGVMHSDAGDHPAAGHDERWERCELGASAADAAMAHVAGLSVPASAHLPGDSVVANLQGPRLVVRYRARAPPA